MRAITGLVDGHHSIPPAMEATFDRNTRMNFIYNKDVTISVGKVTLEGQLVIPQEAGGLVIFSHGSGSSRLSPRNKLVADYLHGKNIGTLLFDLLTPEEDQHFHNRFNIELLTTRLVGATFWVEEQSFARQYRLGFFGASTGAASALKAAASLPQLSAVVSRGGRPDLAIDVLNKVQAPTLLIVGGLDYEVLQLNREAYKRLNCEKKLQVIDGATHLFEERGTMEQVCEHAAAWFAKYLQTATIEI